MAKKYRMNAAQKKWLAALESGEFRRTTAQLKSGRGYCCLGVACKVVGMEFGYGAGKVDPTQGGAPRKVMETMKLRSSLGKAREPFGNDYVSLADANDKGQTFKKIAAAIRLDPSRFFLD